MSQFATVTVNVTPPINPSGFAAVEVGQGEVVFSWLPVTGASHYVLMGPGLPAGGTRVGPEVDRAGASGVGFNSTATVPKVAFMATGIPGGPGVWQVGSFFGPLPVSTPVADFPSVSLNVTLTKK